MKSKTLLVTTVASLALLALTPSEALGDRTWQQDHWIAQSLAQMGTGRYTQYNRMYDPNTIETIRGRVVGTNTFRPGRGMSQGMQLLVKTENQTISVHLGPAWYLDRQDFPIKNGDEVEVTGSRINFSGSPAIIAAEVRDGGKVLKLRDNNGIPLWRGGNYRGMGRGACCW
jgi:hypothetical protein